MGEPVSQKKWIAAGYELFAQGGPDAIVVEKLARILSLNKSGFYHHFIDREIFIEALLEEHLERIDVYNQQILNCKDFDPGFLNVLLQNKIIVLFQWQLLRNKHLPKLFDCLTLVVDITNKSTLPLWAEFIEIPHRPTLALQFFDMLRDTFFARVTLADFNYQFLHELALDTKQIAAKFMKESS